MQNPYSFVLPKSIAFRLSQIVDEIIAYATVAMATEWDFYFEFETF